MLDRAMKQVKGQLRDIMRADDLPTFEPKSWKELTQYSIVYSTVHYSTAHTIFMAYNTFK